MNSPTDLGNSSGGSSSSSDNEADDIAGPPDQPSPFAPAPSTLFGPSGSFSAPKRRLPGGLMFGGSGAREPKSRRKDRHGGGGGGGGGGAGAMGSSSGGGGGGGSYWDHVGGGSMRGVREDFVDTQLVEQLRKEFGDPFDERELKSLTAS